jgi:hypothetical protein
MFVRMGSLRSGSSFSYFLESLSVKVSYKKKRERWLSGLMHWFAKPTGFCPAGSNPVLS